ncbi:DUF3656 domain-containing U32 family peptidase [Alkaliphilus peptidifermentans]|uniref:Putative protease n=1 Tax=Alkaliphilus peptidifermentans DSM 18978 TaxID=1120976 RepID=A0A1G5IX14_9FIRM|nr:U32 family peptidase [Alkaliphilus peptidifermentans]SCY80169.1 putative protease [Alkaliphilus peptidifermentans DSM 18978]
MSTIELLAPAGSFDALKAALLNGADAVYLGGKDFSARAYASNFDRDTLKEAVEFAHIRGMKIYVTINTLLKDTEVNKLLEYVAFLYEIDVDALIIQDLGVLSLIHHGFPDFELHCSTQMTLHNSHGIEVVKELGVKRVVLARELSLEEIAKIHKSTGMELEVFIHGALCVSYSGQCLMSSYIGGRSGNRGRCAQPCRRSYRLLSDEGKGKDNQAYHLSMRDLNTLQYVDQLIDSGVTSFKIEGRMKKPQYVASIVRSYRRAIDNYISTKQVIKDEKTQHEMAQIFNRKFTRGFLFSSPREEITNIEKPNNRGIYLGEVKAVFPEKNFVQLLLNDPLAKGDGVEVWSSTQHDIGGYISALFVNKKPVIHAEKGSIVEFEMKGSIKKGDKVFKTLDINLMNELENTYANKDVAIKIWGEAIVEKSKPMKLYIWDEAGNTVYQESEYIVEEAKKMPISEERVLENLNKLGGTPFTFEHIKLQLEDGVSVPVSSINSLRRGAIDKLKDIRSNHNKRIAVKDIGKKPLKEPISRLIEGNDKKTELSLRIDSIDILKSIEAKEITRVYYGDLNTIKEAIEHCRKYKWEIYFRSPNIVKDKEYILINEKLRNLKLDGILAGDIGMISIGQKSFNLPVVADYTLNPFNSYTIDTLLALGVKGVVLSTELDLKSIGSIMANKSIDIELMAYGKLAVMTLEYCPLKLQKECNHKCHQCNVMAYDYKWKLTDQKNMAFPIAKDFLGRTIILNSQPLYMLDKLKELRKINPKRLQLSITDESPAEVQKLINHIENEDSTAALPKSFTRGHYFRGVE